MSVTWREAPEPALGPPSIKGWLRAALRGGLLALLLGLGLAVSWMLRPIERAFFSPRRPVTPWITVVVCRGVLRVLGLTVRVVGRPMNGPGVVVANHSSWLDIFALNAQHPLVFVAKAEVEGWPGIGLLARATGTLFIHREVRSEVAEQARALTERLGNRETLAFFPEGTSTDGRRVLPFKSALLAGLLAPGLPKGLAVQPVTLSWAAPPGSDPRFYGWWGGMHFGPHALIVLASRPGGVRISYHAPIPVEGRDRKSLAIEAEAAVRRAL